MGLLKQQKEFYDKTHYFWKTHDTRELLAWISDVDGAISIYNERIDSIEKSKAVCQWYLSVCEEL